MDYNLFVRLFGRGLWDSFGIVPTYHLLRRSRTIRRHVGESLLFNFLFVVVYHYAVMNIDVGILIYIYYILFLYPFTIVRICWNLNQCLMLSNRMSFKGNIRIAFAIAMLMYDFVLINIITVFTYGLSFIPYVGIILYYFYQSILIAFNCYDYKWANNGICIGRRIRFVEERWPYFLGFGTVPTLIYFIFPFPYNSGLSALMLSPMVIAAHRTDLDDVTSFNIRYEYFKESYWISNKIINKLLQDCI